MKKQTFVFINKLDDAKIMNAKSEGGSFNLAYFIAIEGIKQFNNLGVGGIIFISH